MEVTIYKLLQIINDNESIIEFNTEFGNAICAWCGAVPFQGRTYDVEVDVDDTLQWGKDIMLAKQNEYSIGVEGNRVYITGQLESIDEDGYTVLRLKNHIIPFMAAGIDCQIGLYIKVKADSIRMTPY